MQQIFIRAAALALVASPLAAQQGAAEPPSSQELQQRLDELERRQREEVEDLRFEIESLEAEVARALQAAQQPPAQSANVFNPQITVFGNFLARSDDQPVYLEGDPTAERIDDTLNLREVEVDFRAAIDPWADGVLILATGVEVPGEYSSTVEEGYVTLKKLPVTGTAPGGLKLKIGRFRPGFGRFNKVHLHDLPSVDYPRSLQSFLGEEGYVQNGFSGQFFLPSPSESSALDATLELLGGGDLPLDEDARSSQLAGLARLGWFQELGEATTLDLGASGWTRGGERTLLGLDATWKWKPPLAGEWRSILVGGELYASSSDDAVQDDAQGFFTWAQYQFSRNVYLGARYDHSEELTDSDLVTHTYSTYLTYYTTEFLRFRLGLEHAASDVDVLDGRNSAFLELNFVFGSHPVEPYWVNR